jgi:hypothetical protein
MGAVVHLRPPATVDEAWNRYIALVNERQERNLWRDAGHNQRLARAWDDWATLFNASEQKR